MTRDSGLTGLLAADDLDILKMTDIVIQLQFFTDLIYAPDLASTQTHF